MPLRIYRRRLPHWRVERATYFVTWCLPFRSTCLTAAERDIVVSVLQHFDGVRYTLHSYVVMNDHVHALVTPEPGVELEQVVHSWKSFSANLAQRMAGRSGPMWLREYHDSIVRSPREFAARLRYIRDNPQRRWPGIGRYPWVWYRGMDDGS